MVYCLVTKTNFRSGYNHLNDPFTGEIDVKICILAAVFVRPPESHFVPEMCWSCRFPVRKNTFKGGFSEVGKSSSKIIISCSVAIGVKCQKQSNCFVCLNSLAANLYWSNAPSAFNFFLKIHL